MLTLVFIKIAADASLYYTFAGFFAAMLGASPAMLVLAMLIQSLALTLSYALRGRGALRLAPPVLALLALLLPGLGIAGTVALIPAWAYVVFLAVKKIYEPDWSQQTVIFSVFWKVLIALCALWMLFGKASVIRSAALPFGLVVLVGSVILMRSLRHDAAVYRSARYQVMNLVIVAVLLGISFFLSSELFLTFCGNVLKTVYNGIIGPILTAIVYLFTYIARVAAYVVSRIRFKEKISLTEAMELGEDLETEVTSANGTGTAFKSIALVIALAIALLIVFLVFRSLARRVSPRRESAAISQSRAGITPLKTQGDAPAAGSPEAKVRAQYKKFLKLFSQRVSAPEKSDTTSDISRKSAGTFDRVATERLREVYISARYGAHATAEDAKSAKELYTQLKKEK